MSRDEYFDDEIDEADIEDEDLDDEGDSDDDLLECPSCHRSVHEDTQQCPHCGDWIDPIHPGERNKRRIWVIVVALILLSWLVMMGLRLV